MLFFCFSFFFLRFFVSFGGSYLSWRLTLTLDDDVDDNGKSSNNILTSFLLCSQRLLHAALILSNSRFMRRTSNVFQLLFLCVYFFVSFFRSFRRKESPVLSDDPEHARYTQTQRSSESIQLNAIENCCSFECARSIWNRCCMKCIRCIPLGIFLIVF